MRRDQRVLEALQQDAKLRGAWWRSDCPFCEERVGKAGTDKTLSVHSNGGGFHCFRCGVKGRVTLPEDLVVERAIVPTQALRAGIDPPEGFMSLSTEPGCSALSLEPARRYLASRGLSEDIIADAGIGACANGLYGGRVVVPVFAEDNATWLGFSSRLWMKNCDKRRKYRNATGEWKATTIYNPNALMVETDEHCYVVEGCFDALSLWPDAVAVLGDATDTQVAMLAKARRPLVVVLDGDAWTKGWALAMKLRLEGLRAGSVQLPVGKDPDEMDPAWLWEEARASLT
jgi:DNA primase